TEILVKTTGTMQMLVRAAGAQTQPEEGQQFSGQPQPQPPEGDDYGFSDDIPF
ncbi:single-stranded DNA-binding protein, partial [Escherichia coli]|nr:single-stranded DNA-binding protein [Escherichia coli]HAL8466137.1 single-stranded DNA-binding protein [Escherichia coli]